MTLSMYREFIERLRCKFAGPAYLRLTVVVPEAYLQPVNILKHSTCIQAKRKAILRANSKCGNFLLQLLIAYDYADIATRLGRLHASSSPTSGRVKRQRGARVVLVLRS